MSLVLKPHMHSNSRISEVGFVIAEFHFSSRQSAMTCFEFRAMFVIIHQYLPCKYSSQVR